MRDTQSSQQYLRNLNCEFNINDGANPKPILGLASHSLDYSILRQEHSLDRVQVSVCVVLTTESVQRDE